MAEMSQCAVLMAYVKERYQEHVVVASSAGGLLRKWARNSQGSMGRLGTLHNGRWSPGRSVQEQEAF